MNQIPIRKAVEFSFIGAYEKALASYELDQSVRESAGEKESALSTEEKIRFKSYQAVEAVAGITKLAKDKKIIILNEAHHKPLHRFKKKKERLTKPGMCSKSSKKTRMPGFFYYADLLIW